MNWVKVLFFDSSALVKLFIKNEVGHKRAIEIFNSGDYNIYTSPVAIGEVFNILKCRLKGGTLDSAIYLFEGYLKGDKIHLVQQGLEYDKIEKTIGDVRSVRKKYNIESTDALHFLMMKYSLGQLTGKSKPKIVSADDRFNEAIQKEGYEVLNPCEDDKKQLGG